MAELSRNLASPVPLLFLDILKHTDEPRLLESLVNTDYQKLWVWYIITTLSIFIAFGNKYDTIIINRSQCHRVILTHITYEYIHRIYMYSILLQWTRDPTYIIVSQGSPWVIPLRSVSHHIYNVMNTHGSWEYHVDRYYDCTMMMRWFNDMFLHASQWIKMHCVRIK